MSQPSFLKKRSFFSKERLLGFLPRGKERSVFFELFLSLLLLLGNLSVGFFNPAPCTPYLPVFAIMGCLAICRFRAVGLSATIVALALIFLFFCLHSFSLLWQAALLCALALNFLILWLSFEETRERIAKNEELLTKEKELFSSLEGSFHRATQEALLERQKFQEEIKELQMQLSEAACEKATEFKKTHLLQRELEGFIAQKEQFIQEARQTRKDLLLQIVSLEEEQKALKDNYVADRLSFNEGKEALLAMQLCQEELKLVLNEKDQEIASIGHVLEAEREARNEEGTLAQKRFNESEEAILSMQLREEELKIVLERTVNEKAQAVASAFHILEEERKERIEERRDALKRFIESQEAILCLQQRPAYEQKCLFEEEQVVTEKEEQLRKESAQLMGSLNQLRKQFNEKSQVLSQTRKELFQTEGKLLAIDLENREEKLTANTEIVCLQKELFYLSAEVARLESEISELEELVTSLI